MNLSRSLDLQSNHTNSSLFTHYRANRISWHLKSHAFSLQQLILLMRLEDNNMTVILKYFYISGLHISGGSRISRRGGRGPPRRLCFKNFACQNERIWTRREGARAGRAPLDPPMHMSHYLGQCASLTGKNYFSNLVSVQQLDTLIGRRRIATNLGMSIKYHTDACVPNSFKRTGRILGQADSPTQNSLRCETIKSENQILPQ